MRCRRMTEDELKHAAGNDWRRSKTMRDWRSTNLPSVKKAPLKKKTPRSFKAYGMIAPYPIAAGRFRAEQLAPRCGTTPRLFPIVPRSALKGDTHNIFQVNDKRRFTYLRLSAYPDGGIARLRVRGQAMPDPRL